MIVLIMGTTGSGKTTIGRRLATRMGWEFADADDFHSLANIQKMKQAIPLTDADRIPWLKAIHDKIVRWIREQKNVVLACSALKQSYRNELLVSPDVKLVYLKGTYDLFFERLLSRKGHFAKEQLLASQFEALEEPSDAITVDMTRSPEEIVAEIHKRLQLE
jgi:gluconokinase